LIEIVSGRIAADLEREMLLNQLLQPRTLARQVTHAAECQQGHLPRIKPLLRGWQVAGWTIPADALGGDFYDWFVVPDGCLAVAVGDAQGKMFEAGLTAATIHSALRAHAAYRHNAQSLLERINETLWTGSAGDQFASMFYGIIQPDTGGVEHASAGHVYAAILGDQLRTFPAPETVPLGTQPDTEYQLARARLEHGESLVVISEGLFRVLRPSRCRALWRLLQNHRRLTADELMERARAFVQRTVENPGAEDQTILVVRRG
jgi:serine phosphatase RsbU (regulator of sigma subunit)